MAASLLYQYRPGDDSEPRIGFVPPTYNAWGMQMTPAMLVSATYTPPENSDERPGIDMTPRHVFTAGEPFKVQEGSPLHEFVRHSLLFRQVHENELRLSGDGKISLVEAKQPEQDSPLGVDPGDETEVFGGAANSSWDAIGKTETEAVMRHGSHHGKRGGNER